MFTLRYITKLELCLMVVSVLLKIELGHTQISVPKIGILMQGFPKRADWWGDNLGKMAKKFMKIIKSAFLGQNSGGDMGGSSQFFR